MFSPALRQLDIKLLLAFHEIYNERHLTRAAAQCGLTQSALSQSLARLRAIFGDPLFVRTSSGMRPTERADAIAASIRDVLVTLGGIVDATAAFDPANTERCLSIGTYQFATITLAPHLLSLFQRYAPKAQIKFTHAGPAEAPHMLARREIDLAIAPFDDIPDGLCKTILMTGDLVVASSRDWVKKHDPLNASTYFAASHVSIVNHGLQADPLDAYFDNTTHRRKIAISVPHYVTALHLVSCSNLLATLPRKPVDWLGDRRKLAIHPAPVSLPPITLSAVWHQRSNFDPFVVWAIGLITSHRSSLLETSSQKA